MNSPNLFLLKRFFILGLGTVVSLIVSYFFARSALFWMPTATFLMLQLNLNARTGLKRFGLVIVLVLLFSLPDLLAVPGKFANYVYLRLSDVSLGALIAILVHLFIFPFHPDVEFRKAVRPILNSYSDYLFAITAFLFRKNNSEKNAEHCKYNLEKTLLKSTPTWVYQIGFSSRMQPGHRHFLIMLDRIEQILFSLHFTARYSFAEIVLRDLERPLKNYVDQVKKILAAFISVLDLKKTEGISDLGAEMTELETVYHNVPVSIELLETTKDYIHLAALIEDLKDLRTVLIRLGQALRE